MKVINIIIEIYNEIRTKMMINMKEMANIEVMNGIRQGCSCSALLFIMVTYYIIDCIQENNSGYKDAEIHIPCLFYADDGLIFAENREEMKGTIRLLEKKASECGLQLNREKCQIMIYNGDDQEDIERIKIVKEIKYLGVIIEDKKKWYI